MGEQQQDEEEEIDGIQMPVPSLFSYRSPSGHRFDPTDQELVVDYLSNKMSGRRGFRSGFGEGEGDMSRGVLVGCRSFFSFKVPHPGVTGPVTGPEYRPSSSLQDLESGRRQMASERFHDTTTFLGR